MGLEADCEARFGKTVTKGRLWLEEKELRFRGDPPLRIPFDRVRSVEARGGRLLVVHAGGRAEFALGAQAERWALKVRYPRPRVDKLGVKPGMRVAVLGLRDEAFLEELRERTTDVSVGRTRKATDIVFVKMAAIADLARLAGLRAAIKEDGAVWVLWPKGQKGFREDDVRAHGPQAGLVDVKVVAFSEVLSGLKMVIPAAQRLTGRRGGK
jgi:hypothetical protein